jgi:hypothetical protein
MVGIGRNSRLTHNRLFRPGRSAPTWRTFPRHSRSPTGPGLLWISLGAIRFSSAPENNLPSYPSGKRLICRFMAQFG